MELFSQFVTLVFSLPYIESSSSNLDDPVLFCDGCFALVSEVEKDMSGSRLSGEKLQARITTSLAGVCSTDRLRAYMFSPPTQVKTCTAILAKYKHLLVSVLREEYRGGKVSSVDKLTQLFCEEVNIDQTSDYY